MCICSISIWEGAEEKQKESNWNFFFSSRHIRNITAHGERPAVSKIKLLFLVINMRQLDFITPSSSGRLSFLDDRLKRNKCLQTQERLMMPEEPEKK